MSCLKLYWPRTLSLFNPCDDDRADDCAGDSSPASDGAAPVILSFPRIAGRIGAGAGRAELLNRARLIYANRYCPECGRASVVPVDAEPALMSRNHMPIPGTGRLVGFECDCCGHAWKAE